MKLKKTYNTTLFNYEIVESIPPYVNTIFYYIDFQHGEKISYDKFIKYKRSCIFIYSGDMYHAVDLYCKNIGIHNNEDISYWIKAHIIHEKILRIRKRIKSV